MKICSISLNKSHLSKLKMFFTYQNKRVVNLYTSTMYENSYNEYGNDISSVHSYIDKVFEKNDVFLEFPFSFVYEYIYNKHPETKFIYVDIEKETWINEMNLLKELYSHDGKPHVFEEFFCNYYFQTGKTKIQDLSPEELSQIYDLHKFGIDSFFAGKDNFIKIDYDNLEFLEIIQGFTS